MGRGGDRLGETGAQSNCGQFGPAANPERGQTARCSTPSGIGNGQEGSFSSSTAMIALATTAGPSAPVNRSVDAPSGFPIQTATVWRVE